MTPTPDLILAGNLIDGTDADPRASMALVLREGRIEAVLPQRDLTPTQRAGTVLDLGDATLLPGLIDTHCHLTFNAANDHATVRKAVEDETEAQLAARAIANAQAHLAGGVTTLRDTGGRGFTTLVVRQAIRDGLVLGPRMQACAPPSPPRPATSTTSARSRITPRRWSSGPLASSTRAPTSSKSARPAAS